MKEKQEAETVIHDKAGNPLDWGWYIAFAVSTMGGYLLYPELIKIIYQESAIGSLGAVFGFLIVFAFRIIANLLEQRSESKKENKNGKKMDF